MHTVTVFFNIQMYSGSNCLKISQKCDHWLSWGPRKGGGTASHDWECRCRSWRGYRSRNGPKRRRHLLQPSILEPENREELWNCFRHNSIGQMKHLWNRIKLRSNVLGGLQKKKARRNLLYYCSPLKISKNGLQVCITVSWPLVGVFKAPVKNEWGGERQNARGMMR